MPLWTVPRSGSFSAVPPQQPPPVIPYDDFGFEFENPDSPDEVIQEVVWQEGEEEPEVPEVQQDGKSILIQAETEYRQNLQNAREEVAEKRTELIMSCLSLLDRDHKRERARHRHIARTHTVETFMHDQVDAHNVGTMVVWCKHGCGALFYQGEHQNCCNSGFIRLPPIQEPPEPWTTLYANASEFPKYFGSTRVYNNMISFGFQEINEVQQVSSGHIPTVTIQGMPFLKVKSNTVPNMGAQQAPEVDHFVVDMDDFPHLVGDTVIQRDRNGKKKKEWSPRLLEAFQDVIASKNRYWAIFKQASTVPMGEERVLEIYADDRPSNGHARNYNLPSSACVGIAMRNTPLQDGSFSLAIKQPEEGERAYKTVPMLHRSYDALFYTLLFPHGDDNWHTNMYTTSSTGAQQPRRLTMAQYYLYRMQYRSGSNVTLRSGRLSQVYFADCFARLERQRLGYLERMQDKQRAESFGVLHDALGQHDLNGLGREIILNSSFTGSPRFYMSLYQDAICLVRELGKPSLFLTFTANPKWPEIQEQMASLGDTYTNAHAPLIIARVFKMKFDELMRDLTVRDIFGQAAACVATIEWQKRGLPHAHILLTLVEQDAIKTAEQVDAAIHAELPDPVQSKELFDLVAQHMMHGPCTNDRCLKNNECTKGFPKKFQDKTVTSEVNYTIYRRRAPGKGGQRVQGRTRTLDNSYVVPYNPWLLSKYKAHLNVEHVFCLETVKYLYKYLTKGQDMLTLDVIKKKQGPAYEEAQRRIAEAEGLRNLQPGRHKRIEHETGELPPINEIDLFKLYRYLSSDQAAWRLMQFPIHHRSHPVTKLQIHLENMQLCIFDPDKEAPSQPPATQLTEYFRFLQENPDFRDVCYIDMPKYAVYGPTKDDPEHTHAWTARKRGEKVVKGAQVDPKGRKYALHFGRLPNLASKGPLEELYYMRLLLTFKPATSFLDLMTVKKVEFLPPKNPDGTIRTDFTSEEVEVVESSHECKSFKETAYYMGLIEGDEGHFLAMKEACSWASGEMLRYIFVMLLIHNTPVDSMALFNKYQRELSDDIRHNLQVQEMNDQVVNKLLIKIKQLVEAQNVDYKRLNLPEPNMEGEEIQDGDGRPDISDHILTPEQMEKLRQEADSQQATLQPQQREAFDAVMASVSNCVPTLFALNACGGSGKTYLLNLLLDKIRSLGYIALACATSGIAAGLLHKGRTLHTSFGLPLHMSETTVSALSKQMAQAKLIAKTDVVVIDEVTMGHQHWMMCVDRAMRDFKDEPDLPFGGAIVIFAGDWRQCLPVVPKGKRSDVVAATVKQAPFWSQTVKLELTTNMRAAKASSLTLPGKGTVSIPTPHTELMESKSASRSGCVDDSVKAANRASSHTGSMIPQYPVRRMSGKDCRLLVSAAAVASVPQSLRFPWSVTLTQENQLYLTS